MYAIIFITTPNKKEARHIAQQLLRARLAACVNIVDKIESLFWWQGKIAQVKEALLIVKTKKALLNKLIKKVKSLHSYQVPEIIASSIIAGNNDYLNWIKESLKGHKDG